MYSAILTSRLVNKPYLLNVSIVNIIIILLKRFSWREKKYSETLVVVKLESLFKMKL